MVELGVIFAVRGNREGERGVEGVAGREQRCVIRLRMLAYVSRVFNSPIKWNQPRQLEQKAGSSASE